MDSTDRGGHCQSRHEENVAECDARDQVPGQIAARENRDQHRYDQRGPRPLDQECSSLVHLFRGQPLTSRSRPVPRSPASKPRNRVIRRHDGSDDGHPCMAVKASYAIHYPSRYDLRLTFVNT